MSPVKSGWALIQPDADEAYVHVWSEHASDPAHSTALAEKYAEKVKSWQEKQL